MIVQMCQMKPRKAKCPMPATTWVRFKWEGYDGATMTKVAACCDRGCQDDPRIIERLGPVECTPRVTA